MSLKQKLRDLVDPATGPLGAILSPADVFKERAGLPISSPHTARVTAETVDPGAILKACAPERIALPQEYPGMRKRMVGRYIVEEWSPFYAKTESLEISDILAASATVVGYKVAQRPAMVQCDCDGASFTLDEHGHLHHKDCGRPMAWVGKEHAEDFREHVQSLQINASDEYLNGFYHTIKGDAVTMIDGKMVKGGTRITGGRKEYLEKTKSYIQWGPGMLAEREKGFAKEKEDRKQATREHAEMLIKKHLPDRGNLAP